MEDLRRFSLVVIDDFDKEVDRFPLDFADVPRNLGFEMQFTTLESKLTTYFTSAREKKLPTTLNLNFLPPNAYGKANAFKRFCQKHMSSRMVFEYYDTTEVKNWEGKIQKFNQEELTDWGGLVCPVSFLPATPKYLRKDNAIKVQLSSVGKAYPLSYPYMYGKSVLQDNTIDNIYFDEIPIRMYVYGRVSNPEIALYDASSGKEYSRVRFENLLVGKGEHLVIDAIRSKVLLYRNGRYISAYDYISKKEGLHSFLFAKGNTISNINVSLNPLEDGYIEASYRQYTL